MPKSRSLPSATNNPPRKKTRVLKVSDKNGFKHDQLNRNQINQLRKTFEPAVKVERKKQSNEQDVRVYHKLSATEVKRMVMMRFQSLTTFDGPVYMSYDSIAKRLNKYVNTVQYAIKHWMKHKQYVDRRKDNGKHVKYKIVLNQLENYILSKETLMDWSGYGLQDRCLMLEQTHKVKISWQALRRFYNKHNVRFLTSNYIYQQALNVDRNEILDFALNLAHLIHTEKNIVYFDESAFNMWLRPRKTWQDPKNPVPLVINKDRGKNVTVYGAIGECLPGAFFKQAETTNQFSTNDFIKQLRTFSKIPIHYPIHLILDNHRAHHTLLVKQTLIDNNITTHFIPPYTPEFNSIEALWSLIKRDMKKRLIDRKKVNVKQLEFHQMLHESLKSVTYEMQANAAKRNNREFIHRILGECLLRLDDPAPYYPKVQNELIFEDPFPQDVDESFDAGQPFQQNETLFDVSQMLVRKSNIASNNSNQVEDSVSVIGLEDSVRTDGIAKLPRRYKQTSLEDSWDPFRRN